MQLENFSASDSCRGIQSFSTTDQIVGFSHCLDHFFSSSSFLVLWLRAVPELVIFLSPLPEG